MLSTRNTIIITASVVIILFLAAAFLSHQYQEQIQRTLQIGPAWVGMSIYAFLAMLSVVIAPIASLPLVPIAAAAWGNVAAALLSALGWVLGAGIAFWIARRFGQPVVKRFVSAPMLEKIGAYIPDQHKHLFWWVVFLRIALPVDELSYALGLFTAVPGRIYWPATILGMMPGAFFFAYLGELPVVFQIISITIGLAIVIAMGYYAKKNVI